ncbi:penicillin-binding protein 2 [Vagococcus coleopterorum]|uniref:Penicillin-binding protein 2 n=1 Tax=Vagococcus coleopterorum TaxID=2714946 RepID=A0A6G8AKY0_9ENTE|nr:penicillin-binding transpeptidase domain-containing protein [Vagococcus coleopterorum]QIL45583.1 penicillin-binding protein 2 [Vagococcus coleopterorum]
MNLEKWRAFIAEKWLEPWKNRRKVGLYLMALTAVVFGVFVLRFIYIVGVGKISGTSLDQRTQELYQGSSVVRAKRGTIYDRNGIPLAEDATSYSLYAVLDKEYLGLADPKTGEKEKLYVQAEDKEAVAKVLEKYLEIDKKEALEQLELEKNADGKPVAQVEFGKKGRGISLETKNKIEEDLEKKKIKGVYFNSHAARMYPNGVFAPYLIGYAASKDLDDEEAGLEGKMGIEKSQNETLAGTDGKVRYQKDKFQNPQPGSTVVEKEAVDGSDIYTTLDSTLQLRLEDLLTESYEEYGQADITATLMEAKTGRILAASQRPGFNPETMEGLDTKDAQWQNLLVEQPFEPGSTMKVFTVAAAIETGVFKEKDTFDSGMIEIDDAKINDWIPEGAGRLTYRQALAWSSNVGMVKLQRMMDLRWLDYVQKFGFTKSTNSGLPGENAGSIQKDTTVDRAMSAYGQAISVTPFQMMQGFTAISNNGKMLKPQYISKIVGKDGKEKVVKPEVVGEPIKASTAKKVREMMVDVTEDEVYGTGSKYYKIDGYHVAAKTGTAQISENGQYLHEQYLYSVVQMAPADDPEYVMYVTMRKPPLGTDGPELIAKISNSLLKRALEFDTTVQPPAVKEDEEDEEETSDTESEVAETESQTADGEVVITEATEPADDAGFIDAMETPVE